MDWTKDKEAGLIALAGVLLRVVLIIALWLVVFLFVFLGYMTIPIVLLAVFLAIFTVFDFRAARKRLAARRKSGGNGARSHPK